MRSTSPAVAEIEAKIETLDEALKWAASALEIESADDSFAEPIVDRENIAACLAETALADYLAAISTESDGSIPWMLYRIDGRPEELKFNVATMKWSCGAQTGRGIVPALVAFTGRPESDVVNQLFHDFGRNIFEYVAELRRNVKEARAKAPRARGLPK